MRPDATSRDKARLTPVSIAQRLHEIHLNRIQEPVRQEVIPLEEAVEAGSRQRQDHGALAGTTIEWAGPLVEQAEVRADAPGAGDPYALLAFLALDRRFYRASERDVQGIQPIARTDEQLAARELEPSCS